MPGRFISIFQPESPLDRRPRPRRDRSLPSAEWQRRLVQRHRRNKFAAADLGNESNGTSWLLLFFTIPLAEHGPKETESSWLSFHFRSSSFFCKIAAADLTQDLRNESNRTSWLLLFFKKKMSIPLVEDGPKETEPSWLSFHFRLSRSYSWVQAVVSERCGARSDER